MTDKEKLDIAVKTLEEIANARTAWEGGSIAENRKKAADTLAKVNKDD